MNDFWNNISRYPRFFISSLVGLILVLLTPFRNLLKIKKLRFLFPLCLVGILFLFYWILKNMMVF